MLPCLPVPTGQGHPSRQFPAPCCWAWFWQQDCKNRSCCELRCRGEVVLAGLRRQAVSVQAGKLPLALALAPGLSESRK